MKPDRAAAAFRRISLDSPPEVLDAFTRCESVHRITGPDDLRRRLDPVDRRCFGLFQPDLAVAVAVALTQGLADSIHALLAPRTGPPPEPDTAIFYAINNCRRDLLGRGYGENLLHRVMAELADPPLALSRFATLSPVPGLTRWRNRSRWRDDPNLAAACADYLVNAKRDGAPVDRVARFHLRNGARLVRINLDADTSERGRARSAGVMVNYEYEPDRLSDRAAAYAADGTVAVSDDLI